MVIRVLFFGALGLVFSIIWWFCVCDSPTKYPNISKQELFKIFHGLDYSRSVIEQKTISFKLENDKDKLNQLKLKKKPIIKIPWLKLLTSKDVYVVALANFA